MSDTSRYATRKTTNLTTTVISKPFSIFLRNNQLYLQWRPEKYKFSKLRISFDKVCENFIRRFIGVIENKLANRKHEEVLTLR